MRENKIYFIEENPVMTVGLVKEYKGEDVVVYRDGNGKLALMNYDEFISSAQEVEEL